MAPPIKHNLEGRQFGRLLAIELTDPYICVSAGRKERRWECLCNCGKLKKIKQTNLLNGKTKSCGCLKRRDANGLFCKAV